MQCHYVMKIITILRRAFNRRGSWSEIELKIYQSQSVYGICNIILAALATARNRHRKRISAKPQETLLRWITTRIIPCILGGHQIAAIENGHPWILQIACSLEECDALVARGSDLCLYCGRDERPYLSGASVAVADLQTGAARKTTKYTSKKMGNISWSVF